MNSQSERKSASASRVAAQLLSRKTLSPLTVGLCLLPSSVGLVGCATSSRNAPDITHIQLARVSSQRLTVDSIALTCEETGVFLDGVVSKNPRDDSTAGTHLDVTFYGRSGSPFAEQVADFTPQEIPARFRGVGGRARYRVRVDHPLTAIGRIEVRAHESAHP